VEKEGKAIKEGTPMKEKISKRREFKFFHPLTSEEICAWRGAREVRTRAEKRSSERGKE